MPRHPHRLAALVLALTGVSMSPALSVLAEVPDRIELPDDWQSEGITALGDQLFVGSLSGGAIWQVDSNTGEGSLLVPDQKGRVAVGIDAEAANGRLWVAGGRTGEVRAYDIESGKLLQTYPFEAGFINDVVATPEAIYATDLFEPQLLVIPLRPDGGLRHPARATTVPLTGDFEYREGFNANGIVATPAGLIVVQTQPGALFLVDPDSGATRAIDVGDIALGTGDGLEIDGQTLYVVRNQAEIITALQLNDEFASASLLAELTSDDLDVPATAALTRGGLWAANARFGTPNSPANAFWLTRLDPPAGAGTPQPSPAATASPDPLGPQPS